VSVAATDLGMGNRSRNLRAGAGEAAFHHDIGTNFPRQPGDQDALGAWGPLLDRWANFMSRFRINHHAEHAGWSGAQAGSCRRRLVGFEAAMRCVGLMPARCTRLSTIRVP
jgi:hypothetical protein